MVIRGRYVRRPIVTPSNLDNVRDEIANETGPAFTRVAVPHWTGKTVLRGHHRVDHIGVPGRMDKSDGPPGSRGRGHVHDLLEDRGRRSHRAGLRAGYRGGSERRSDLPRRDGRRRRKSGRRIEAAAHGREGGEPGPRRGYDPAARRRLSRGGGPPLLRGRGPADHLEEVSRGAAGDPARRAR